MRSYGKYTRLLEIKNGCLKASPIKETDKEMLISNDCSLKSVSVEN